jgi:hypothetical protein
MQRPVQMLCFQTVSWFLTIADWLAWKVVVRAMRMKARNSTLTAFPRVLNVTTRRRDRGRTYGIALQWVVSVLIDLSRFYFCSC